MSLDMTLLPPPAVVEALDFESILRDHKAQFQALCAGAGLDYSLLLESDPITKLLELGAYREMLLRQRINDAAKACMLAYAVGTDLDHLAANLQVQRLLVTPAAPQADPPVPAVYEDDDRLRLRAQLSFEGITTAGPRESYRFHALGASALVADVGVDSPTPGTVRVTVLATNPSGVPTTQLLDTVRAALNAEEVRPLCDIVKVQAPQIIESAITATLHLKPGPAGQVGAAAAAAALDKWLAAMRRLGAGLPRSGIDAALHQAGMNRVDLIAPAADILCDRTQWVRVTSINLTTVTDGEDD